MQNYIIEAIQSRRGLVLYEETFILPGSHGDHRVLVFPLQGPRIREYHRKKPAATRILAASQVLQALNQLHNIGVVHRDVTSSNVLYSFHLVEQDDPTLRYQYIGRPRKMLLESAQWKKGELVMPMQADRSFRESMVGDTVSLGDFGIAIKAGTPVKRKFLKPAIYCAPEVLHGADPSFASDMWSYMCLFAELYCARALFSGAGNSDVLSCTVDTLGPLPETWKGRYEAGGPGDDRWYDRSQRPEPTMNLESKIAKYRPDASLAERELVVSVLRRGLAYLPEERPAAEQLLDDTSFQALMEICRRQATSDRPIKG
ncbi:kinase domain-containing protein [Nemania sp. FL0916]|nr:kinase domain-containing protein [Nemania sp. FL0916]